MVNLSLNSTVEQSYHLSRMNAAAEILWFNGVVVVVSSVNADGSGKNYANTAPANHPFVITVGASDELTTSNYSDDTIATYTAWTTTMDGHLKPDIFAPGTYIISTLSGHSSWPTIAPERVVDGSYFRLSGTSMAAPMVTGASRPAAAGRAKPDSRSSQVPPAQRHQPQAEHQGRQDHLLLPLPGRARHGQWYDHRQR